MLTFFSTGFFAGLLALLLKARNALKLSRYALLSLAMCLGISACGFHLRSAVQMPFDSIYIGFSPTSPLGVELRRYIRATTNTIIESDVKQAQAVLDVLAENQNKEVLTITSQGQVREFELQYRVTFRLHDGKGKEFIAPSTIALKRTVSFNDGALLAKESEEALLYREMRADLVQQLLRRLAAAKLTP